MNQELLNYIRHLSKQDKKSLAEKALKTQEEVGELAKVVLPYVSAYATNHRFTERERILEEAVDTVLCALSVAYDLDFTDEEVESMVKLKSTKWAGLQAGEEGLTYPIPFEIHITLKPHAFRDIDKSIERFRQVCKNANVKPIILDLQDQAGMIIQDVMTSSTHFGTNTSAYLEAKALASCFNLEYEVVRVKIETVPWHPASPKSIKHRMPENCYFEAHIPIIHNPDMRVKLEDAVTGWRINNVHMPVHLSRNVFKKHQDGNVTTMITYRTEVLKLRDFDLNVNKIVDYFKNWTVGKVHKEFSIYDTNKSHDAAWLLSK